MRPDKWLARFFLAALTPCGGRRGGGSGCSLFQIRRGAGLRDVALVGLRGTLLRLALGLAGFLLSGCFLDSGRLTRHFSAVDRE